MENTQMQSDLIQNNRKLEACLENVQNAIILLEVNNKETEKETKLQRIFRYNGKTQVRHMRM